MGRFKQIDKLKNALRTNKYSKLPKVQADLQRAEFDKVKNKLIAEWEKETGQAWPRYTENLMTKNGKKVARKKCAAYEAHHIIGCELGGSAEWWNIHPAKYPSEHQGGIHGSGSSLRKLLDNIKKIWRTNVFEKIRSLMKNGNENPDYPNVYYPVNEEEITATESRLGCPLPEQLRAFHREIGYCIFPIFNSEIL